MGVGLAVCGWVLSGMCILIIWRAGAKRWILQ